MEIMTYNIKELLKTIRGGNVSHKLKVEIYAEIKKCIELNIGTEAIGEQDLYIVSEDLDNSDPEIREAAWSIINLSKISVGSEIFNRLIKLVNDNNTTLELYTKAKEHLVIVLENYIKAPDFCLEKLLEKYHNETEIITMLFIEVCTRFSKTETADIICDKLFPFIFSTENENLRDAAIEIGMGITAFNTLADLDVKKHKAFLDSIENEYILSIRNVFGKMKHSNWHNMFTLLLRYGGIIFHQRVDITNAILKIAEAGFKASSVESKLLAFDCWKELINNYSLNLKHMTMTKHIKLLVTPLKANLSSNEVVIHKRFEIWVHLLKKLEDRAVICLEHFLNFCFGPLGANPLIGRSNPGIASPGKKVVRLCSKSPKFFLEVLGHYGHNSNDPCVKCDEELKLNKPIVNNSNFQEVYTPVIHSVGECCLILSKWNSNTEELSRVIHCMWGSLLNFIKELNSDKKEAVHKVLCNQLLALSKVAENDSNFIESILMPIINTIMSFKCTNVDENFLKPVLAPSLKYLNAAGKFNMTRLRQSMDVAFSSKRNLVKVRMFGEFCELIVEIEKVKLSYPLWITLRHFVPDLCRTCPINEVFFGYLLMYMLWPVNNYNYIPDDEKQNVINTWKKLIEEICKNSALMHKNHHNFQTSIIHSFQKIIKKTPLVINSVSLFLSILSIDFQKNDDLDPLFISDLLQLILDLLDCPITPKDNINKLEAILTVCINNILKLPNEKTDLIYEKLFKAIQYFLQPHQIYSVLDKLENILSENSTSKETLPNALKCLITDLTLHKDSEISRTAIKILSLLENTTKDDQLKSSSENFIQNSNSLLSRSSTKAMVQKSTKPTFVENIRVIQQLLEENTSPMKLKGSQLKNSPKSSKKSTTSTSLPFTTKKEPSRANKKETYEVIENNYKFDKRKLTEHQKEKMKERREDIPALYQDLSQSQTDCTSNSQSNSQDDLIGKDLKIMPSPESTKSIFQTQNNNVTDNGNENCNNTNSHLKVNNEKEKNLCNELQQIELVLEKTNETERECKKNVLSPKTSNEDIFAGTNLNAETKKPKKTRNLTNKEQVKKRSYTNELSRLKMDIVGGDININVNEVRKSRRSSKQFDKVNSPFIYQIEKRKYVKTPKAKGKAKRKNVKTKISNSNNTSDKETPNSNSASDKETPKKKQRKKRSQSLTDNNGEAFIINNNLRQRSRCNSETKKCNSNNGPLSSGNRDLLKNQNSDCHSEDIIESSQDSYVSIGKSFTNSNQISKTITTPIVNSLINTDEDQPDDEVQPTDEIQPVLTGSVCTENCNDQQPNSPQSEKKSEKPDIIFRQSEVIKGFREKTFDLPTTQIVEIDTNEELKETAKEQRSSTIVISEDFSPDKLIRKDLDQIETKLNVHEIEIAEARTESPPIENLDDSKACTEILKVFNEPQELEIVSCIREEKDAIDSEKEEKTPSLFNSEIEVEDQKVCETNLQNLENDIKIVDNENKTKMVSQRQRSSRSARLVGLATATNSIGENSLHMNPLLKKKLDAISFKTASIIFSPKTSRIRKMMQNCEDQKKPLLVIDLDEEAKEKNPENQLLQFSREVPSPLATPKSSILKRKRDTNDYLSDDNFQLTKRKRVNFSDPPTTCKKVFIQHQDELVNRHRGIKKNLLLTTKPSKETDTPTAPAENCYNAVIVIEEECHKATIEEVSSESSSKEIVDIEMTEMPDKIPLSDENVNIESSENPNLLDDAVPICPELIDCLENVEIISNNLKSPLSKSALLEELYKNNIHTVGDLAFLTEKKINDLSLDPPKMTEIKHALFKFKEAEKMGTEIEVINNDTEHVLDSDNVEKTDSSENIIVLEESDLNSRTALINCELNNLSSCELRIQRNMPKSPEKKIAILENIIVRPADILEKVQSPTNQNLSHFMVIEQSNVRSESSQNGESFHNEESSINNQSIAKENSPEPSHGLVPFDQVFVKGTQFEDPVEKLEENILNAINKLPESQDGRDVLKRLIETIFDKMPSSMAWNIIHEYLTNRVFVNGDCE